MVDAVDRVLDLLAADPEYRFLLDGQAVVVEDYLAVRPGAGTSQAVRDGRMAVGPWFVQPDTLLPAGESHVRNLLGRRARRRWAALRPWLPAGLLFTHMPQILAGFGLRPFVYWRGNGDEIAQTGPRWRWVAPPDAPASTPSTWSTVLRRGRDRHRSRRRRPSSPRPSPARTSATGPAHEQRRPLVPQGHTRAVAEALAAKTGATVHRAVLDDFAGALSNGARPEWSGDLLGDECRPTCSRACGPPAPAEAAQPPGREPAGGLGRAVGRSARCSGWPTSGLRSTAAGGLAMLHAHDSICGCSIDPVHARMDSLRRRRRAGPRDHPPPPRGWPGWATTALVPWSVEQDVAVFNLSPRPSG